MRNATGSPSAKFLSSTIQRTSKNLTKAVLEALCLESRGARLGTVGESGAEQNPKVFRHS